MYRSDLSTSLISRSLKVRWLFNKILCSHTHRPFPIQIHVAMQVVTESTYTSLSEYIFLRHEVKYVSYSLPEEAEKLKV